MSLTLLRLISLAIKLDNCRERRRERCYSSFSTPPPRTHSHSPAAERERRREVYYSPVGEELLLSQTIFSSVSPLCMQIQATLCFNLHSLLLLALVDSGANDDFLDVKFASQVGILVELLESLITVTIWMEDFWLESLIIPLGCSWFSPVTIGCISSLI